MRAHDLFEARSAPIYHGYQDEKYALQALEENRMAATSTQRFWKGGKRLKDNHPDYRGSYWMKGVSFTRDIRFAQEWGSIVFILDQAKIAQKYKFLPFNWGYSIPSQESIKREREEYVIIKATPDTYERDEEDGGGFDMNRFLSAEGYMSPLSDFLLGIMANKELLSHEEIAAHPKFIGFY